MLIHCRWKYKMVRFGTQANSDKTKHFYHTIQAMTLLDLCPKNWKLTSSQKPLHGCLGQPYSKIAKTWTSSKYLAVCEWINSDKTNGPFSGTNMKWAFRMWRDMEETHTRITQWKTPIWKGCALYGFPCKTFQKRQNEGANKSKNK